MNAGILWHGPSALDGAPIIVIATGLKRPSTNPKTGDMVQTYILRDDVHPMDALRDGRDKSICGDCALAGWSGCYVNVRQAPSNLWKARNVMPRVHSLPDKPVRIGTYGDPSAVPLSLWANFVGRDRKWTAFTHQWRDPRMEAFRTFAMASTEDTASTMQARSMGWRTFRVRVKGGELLPGEIDCPAEPGKVTCASCQLCRGGASKAKSISIEIHGGAIQARRAGHVVRWSELLHAGKLSP